MNYNEPYEETMKFGENYIKEQLNKVNNTLLRMSILIYDFLYRDRGTTVSR